MGTERRKGIHSAGTARRKTLGCHHAAVQEQSDVPGGQGVAPESGGATERFRDQSLRGRKEAILD